MQFFDLKHCCLPLIVYWLTQPCQAQANIWMDNLQFSDYSAILHSTYIATATITSLFANCLLLFIIYTTVADHIGSYRLLIEFFALGNIANTALHASLQPYVHMTANGFYMFSKFGGVIIGGICMDSILLLTFVATFFQTYIVIVFQFIYRYYRVNRELGGCTSGTRHMLIVIVLYITYIAAFSVSFGLGMKTDEEQSASADLLSALGVNSTSPSRGFIAISLQGFTNTNDTLTDVINSDSSIPFVLFILMHVIAIVFFSFKTISAKQSESLHVNSRKMHDQLFFALHVQTSLTCILSYFPIAMILLFGVVSGTSLGAFGDSLILITLICPSMTAFAVLYCILEFRYSVVRLFKLPCSWGTLPVWSRELTTAII